jgi:hypothetical protein
MHKILFPQIHLMVINDLENQGSKGQTTRHGHYGDLGDRGHVAWHIPMYRAIINGIYTSLTAKK